jgi:uncharacterized protein
MSRIKIASRAGVVAAGQVLHTPLPDDYTALFSESDATIQALTKPYKRTAKIYRLLQQDVAVDAHWNMANYTTVAKMNYNDHGPIHARVTCAYAMQMMALLVKHNVPLDVVTSGTGDLDDAHLVVLAGILLHDIGNSLHRTNHEAMGVILAERVLERLLPKLYRDIEQRTLISNFILSMVQCHDMNPAPLFMEGAIVAVCDGCDMTKGRARMPFDLGKIDIHAVSALSIEDVNILPSAGPLPVEIEVLMSNSAGIFQVEHTLIAKLNQTPLKRFVTVRARTINVTGDNHDKRIVDELVLKDGRLTPQP